ncbi:MAG: HPr family phosphocarrier protein [Deltaproteobacteria bacterium]|jgi:phosphotransferase system HPr (HPr) family protein|nr:HPr family phosphocarrier protein [Deltaproteobacteria bacterium]
MPSADRTGAPGARRPPLNNGPFRRPGQGPADGGPPEDAPDGDSPASPATPAAACWTDGDAAPEETGVGHNGTGDPVGPDCPAGRDALEGADGQRCPADQDSPKGTDWHRGPAGQDPRDGSDGQRGSEDPALAGSVCGPDGSGGTEAPGADGCTGGSEDSGGSHGSNGSNGPNGSNGKSRPFIREQSLIRNRLGLHSRAAARLSQALEPFDCEIYIEKGEIRADAKNILDLISLCCPSNTRVTLVARGPEAGPAIDAAREIIHNRFGEDE